MVSHADPGYGDPLAPIGTAEWAKRWRLVFQTAVKRLPSAPGENREFFEIGAKHRAWTLVTNKDGNAYPDFDAFCRDAQPWGLGMDPTKFRAYLAAEIGERAAELVTVAPAQQGERNDLETSSEDRTKSGHDRTAKLRAILRAPEIVQRLYRDGLVSQGAAAIMGPARPDEETARRIVRARQAVEALPRNGDDRHYRRQVDAAIRTTMGRAEPTPLERVQKAYRALAEEDQAAFRDWLEAHP